MKKSKLKYATITIACSVLAGCAANTQPMVQPEIFINSTNTDAIASEVVRLCDERNWNIIDQSDRMVTCSANAGMMANVLLGTRGGSGVSKNATFTIIPFRKEKKTKLTGRAWFENQNAFGGVQKNNLDHAAGANHDLNVFIRKIKERVEK
ncbi:MAG TPA: hypothetical protein PLK94_13335 [Alphaproteobacteria bacterium]|nr:hypothetical protein [Alphaproteobacteria bacterium]